MPRVRAHLLTIGDELLAGDIVDRHKAWLGEQCRKLGIEVVRATTVRDREDEIVAAMRTAGDEVELCLVSGGLGPTTDDLTVQSAAKAAGVELERHADIVARLEAFFSRYGRELVEANLKQADLPVGATVLDNPIGTAPGFALSVGGCRLYSMPGVPRELHLMFREQVVPRLRERFELQARARRVYRAVGRGESSLQQVIGPVLDAARERSPGLANMFVHYRARYPEVQLLLEGTPGEAGDGARATAEELAGLDDALREAIGPAVYSIGPGDGGPELAQALVEALSARGLTVVTAESCTGGGVGQAITSVAGSSAVFLGGVIAYANAVKEGQLGVPAEALAEHGAVSEPVARAMAEGARERLGADLGISTTGIAGPGGGSKDKPVGTVDVAIASAAGTTYERLRVLGKRETVRKATVMWALKLAWDHLELGVRVDDSSS
ncbi:Competence-damaged protein [Plesiocystis pacifica SIR-1]|uniref:CinA-like protein n=1 Tax=Plesiocystis pacifica SIR-1 TaxID=391625 RepID=A6GK07_9BACT|nr:CinA family nicotinamide mononucleotide deamidase-related protein [Plesiocystis pacifica]EDM73789.1 Competence-damaged protein [Plesiocystis pacifica SIR-1]